MQIINYSWCTINLIFKSNGVKPTGSHQSFPRTEKLLPYSLLLHYDSQPGPGAPILKWVHLFISVETGVPHRHPPPGTTWDVCWEMETLRIVPGRCQNQLFQDNSEPIVNYFCINIILLNSHIIYKEAECRKADSCCISFPCGRVLAWSRLFTLVVLFTVEGSESYIGWILNVKFLIHKTMDWA